MSHDPITADISLSLIIFYTEIVLKISATPNSLRMNSEVNKTQNMPTPQKNKTLKQLRLLIASNYT